MSQNEHPASEGRPDGPGLVEVDLNEYGGKKDGERQAMNRRLFMQLLVFDVAPDVDPVEPLAELQGALADARIPAVVYEDANAPSGLGLLTWSEDATHFVDRVRPLFRRPGLRCLHQRRDHTMMGRTYAVGYERELEHWLLRRSAENVTDPEWRWHVWYPLRRSGAFEKLDRAGQASVLREHAAIGLAYGKRGLAHDVRLACHGLDAADNEFVIGLIGKELHPLSHVVQRMRSTTQTAEYIVQMGPFFTGYARYQSREGEAP